MSDCSVVMETTTARSKEEEEEEDNVFATGQLKVEKKRLYTSKGFLEYIMNDNEDEYKNIHTENNYISFDTENLLVIFLTLNQEDTLCVCVFLVTVAEFELCVDEPEELLVDNPAEVSWLAELLHGASVNGPLVFPSSHWAGKSKETSKKECLITCLSFHNLMCSVHSQPSPWKWNRWASSLISLDWTFSGHQSFQCFVWCVRAGSQEESWWRGFCGLMYSQREEGFITCSAAEDKTPNVTALSLTLLFKLVIIPNNLINHVPYIGNGTNNHCVFQVQHKLKLK